MPTKCRCFEDESLFVGLDKSSSKSVIRIVECEDISYLKNQFKIDKERIIIDVFDLIKICSNKQLDLKVLLKNAEFLEKTQVFPIIDIEYEKRKELLQNKLLEDEFQNMINYGGKKTSIFHSSMDTSEFKSVSAQITFCLNFLLTIIGCFFFGYFATLSVFDDKGLRVLAGIALSSIVVIAEIYFIIKFNPS